ncbi:hypothetical protein BJ970_007596 [Saccharopolyspora phatthalungensis]|uniref:Uncharacterized protein n=1 Tax=Saccharopolyspora phatthalungensis TaxID=664693 RepID=A0A840QKK4_9PSEU|nr:hypothetical protein [Saccharopolyspora phatthalungensis]
MATVLSVAITGCVGSVGADGETVIKRVGMRPLMSLR